MDYLHSAAEFYKWADSISDQRIQHWLFVDSPLPLLCILLAYLTFVLSLGPRLMEDKHALSLKPLLVLYNMALSLLNLYICIEVIYGAISSNYAFPCAPLDLVDKPPQMRISAALWWYYFSKIIELLDTVFFVLRKKNSQISFLHVYHHSTMPLLWWVGMKWLAGGQSIYGPIINGFVHIVMYFYYAVAALGPQYQKYLWWKKYLTQMQLIQFCYTIIHCASVYYLQCPYQDWMYLVLIIYMVSFVVLFGNFYIQSYINKSRSPKTTSISSGTTSSANGDSNGAAHTKSE